MSLPILAHAAANRAPANPSATLDRETVEALLATCDDASVQAAARAWLVAYDVASSFHFGERVARRQAATAWDLVQTAPLVVAGCTSE